MPGFPFLHLVTVMVMVIVIRLLTTAPNHYQHYQQKGFRKNRSHRFRSFLLKLNVLPLFSPLEAIMLTNSH